MALGILSEEGGDLPGLGLTKAGPLRHRRLSVTTRAFVLDHTTKLLVKQLKVKYPCEGYFWRITRTKTIRGEKRVEFTSNRFWLQTSVKCSNVDTDE